MPRCLMVYIIRDHNRLASIVSGWSPEVFDCLSFFPEEFDEKDILCPQKAKSDASLIGNKS